MRKEIKKAPTIRFQGFTDDWEQRKLGEIGSTFTGLSGKTKEDFGHGDARFVTYMNVYSNSIADLAMTERVEIDQTQNSVKYGDIFFTTSSETPNEVGMSSVWLGNTENTYLNSFCFGYRPEVKVNPYYMAYMLRSPNVRNKLIILAQGISRYNISKNRVMDIEVPTPDLSEQKEIGQYFFYLDYIITLHQRKLDQLKKLKKYFLQNLFPAKGEKVPKIRLKGFTGNWEEWKLGDLMDVGSVKRIHQSDWRPYGIRFLRARDIIAIFKKEPVDEYLYIDEKTYEEYSSQSGKVSKGDLLVTGVGTIGVPMLVDSDNPIYFKDGNIIWFKNNNKIDGNFFYYSFTAKAVQDYIRESAGIGTVGTYTIESGKKTPISLPKDIKEQKEVGELFHNLNQSICLHKRKLEGVQTLKKYMLQNMFI